MVQRAVEPYRDRERKIPEKQNGLKLIANHHQLGFAGVK
jgi:hypothetical protein